MRRRDGRKVNFFFFRLHKKMIIVNKRDILREREREEEEERERECRERRGSE